MKEDLNIRDEEHLLTGLCRTLFDADLIIKLKDLVKSDIDWDYFTGKASDHGVAALVYHNLEKLDLLAELPQPAIAFLKQNLLKSLSRNTYNTEELAGVLSILTGNNIKTVLLKGIALEFLAYGNEGLRQMTDIDVLMTREDCLKARLLLLDNGFTELPVKSVLHRSIIGYIGKHLPTLIKGPFRLELHHELFGTDNSALTKHFYDTVSEIMVKGEKAFVPQPFIFFLYLIKHLYLHEMNNESQLRLYTDLVVLIETSGNEILTERLIDLAAEAGMDYILAGHLEPLRNLWGMTFPAHINELIDKHSGPGTIDKFLFFLKSPKNNPVPDRSVSYRRIFREIPGLHRKALYLSGDLFPTVSFMKKRYGCTTGWGTIPYYPIRWGKLWYLLKK